MGGVSLLLIERGPGVKTTQMKCSGVWPSGTTYVIFEDVKVPVENLIGKENQGFKYIMCVHHMHIYAVLTMSDGAAIGDCDESGLVRSSSRSLCVCRICLLPFVPHPGTTSTTSDGVSATATTLMMISSIQSDESSVAHPSIR